MKQMSLPAYIKEYRIHSPNVELMIYCRGFPAYKLLEYWCVDILEYDRCKVLDRHSQY